MGAAQEAAEASQSSKGSKAVRVQANPMLEGLQMGQYVLRAAARVKAADLEQALLMLPFHDALRLLEYLRDGLASGSEVRLISKFKWGCVTVR